jgi:hypothetical protein
MSNDIVLQITQATQRTFPLHQFKVLQPLPLSDDELDADDEAEAPFGGNARGSASKRPRANTISRGKTSDDETPSWTEQEEQHQDHIQVLKACCVRNTPIVSNWLYQNITSLSTYLLKTALAQLRKITA